MDVSPLLAAVEAVRLVAAEPPDYDVTQSIY